MSVLNSFLIASVGITKYVLTYPSLILPISAMIVSSTTVGIGSMFNRTSFGIILGLILSSSIIFPLLYIITDALQCEDEECATAWITPMYAMPVGIVTFVLLVSSMLSSLGLGL